METTLFIPDEMAHTIANLDSFDLDKEISMGIAALDEEDPNQLLWIAALLLDKRERVVNV